MIIEPRRISLLSAKERKAIMDRSLQEISEVYEHVRGIVQEVKNRGDDSIIGMCREFKEDVRTEDLEATKDEIKAAYDEVNPNVVEALRSAAKNISAFHRAQREREMWCMEVREGILAGRIVRPIDRVGCYIPGGRAVYPSTILMTVIPAAEAGVREIVATTPAWAGMKVNPATLVAADIAGCDRIFKVGGPWGVAALAFGTDTLPKVDKIVGPGNKYVTAAKMIVYGQVDIDSPAGPSEALILVDDTADARFVELDFLSQIEHDPDSSAVVVSTSEELADEVCRLIDMEFPHLPRKEIFDSSIKKNSHVLIARDMDEAIDFVNEYAPEHLQIMTSDPFMTLNLVRHAGSIFLGPYAPVPAGDYASGTNHVLPTGRCARMFSGLSIDDFIKKPTFQYLSKGGLSQIKNIIVTLAEAEGLPMHARAVKARFGQLS